LTKTTTSQNQFFISLFCKMKSSSTCLITSSLCEGPFFYFYVESPPSTFMHHLREHSCHSEFNVHSPKGWFMIMVLFVLKLFVSSRPLKLEGVLCIYVLQLHEGQDENHFAMFFYMIWTHTWLSMFHYSWSFVCVTFHVNMVAKFYCQDYISYAHVLSTLIPALNALHRWLIRPFCITILYHNLLLFIDMFHI
jgi:hypothetical protein